MQYLEKVLAQYDKIKTKLQHLDRYEIDELMSRIDPSWICRLETIYSIPRDTVEYEKSLLIQSIQPVDNIIRIKLTKYHSVKHESREEIYRASPHTAQRYIEAMDLSMHVYMFLYTYFEGEGLI